MHLKSPFAAMGPRFEKNKTKKNDKVGTPLNMVKGKILQLRFLERASSNVIIYIKRGVQCTEYSPPNPPAPSLKDKLQLPPRAKVWFVRSGFIKT